MQRFHDEYMDYAALDQRDRGILRHLIFALAAGVGVGVVGAAIHIRGLRGIEQVYDPYAYFILVTIVGRTSSGYWWALLSSTMAAFGPLIPALVAIGITDRADVTSLGGSASGLNILLLLLVVFGMAAYVTRRDGSWGDLAAGVMFGVLLADVADRSLPGRADSIAGFWPWKALLVSAIMIGLLVAVRPRLGGRVHALSVALVIGVGYLAFIEGL
jgi:hypothetical protein